MGKAYFVYSQNKGRDDGYLAKLHKLLPFNMDLIRAKIKDNFLYEIDNKNKRVIVPQFLYECDRPIYIAGDALDVLVKIEENEKIIGFKSIKGISEFLKQKIITEKNLQWSFRSQKKLINGTDDIESFIGELEKGGYFKF